MRQPKTTGGHATVAQRWQNLPTIHRWATRGMLSGKVLEIYFCVKRGVYIQKNI